MQPRVNHPADLDLALYSGGDLAFLKRWQIGSHVRSCNECRERVERLKMTRERLIDLAREGPAGLDWNRLAKEMTGNIRVGLAAADAIAEFDVPESHPRPLRWAAALALSCAMVIGCTSLWLRLPKEQSGHLMASLSRLVQKGTSHLSREGVVLQASPSSIEVREAGGSMSLMVPASENASVSVNLQGSAGARYIDSDTGQVTINRVYYAQ